MLQATQRSLSQSNYKKASYCLRQLIDLSSGDEKIQHIVNLAICLRKLGSPAESRSTLRQYLTSSKDSRLVMALANLELHENNRSTAAVLFKQIIKTAKSESLQANARLNLAIAFFKGRAYEKAIRVIDHVLQTKNCDEITAIIYKISCLTELHKFEHAEAITEIYRSVVERNAQLATVASQNLLRQKKYDRAYGLICGLNPEYYDLEAMLLKQFLRFKVHNFDGHEEEINQISQGVQSRSVKVSAPFMSLYWSESQNVNFCLRGEQANQVETFSKSKNKAGDVLPLKRKKTKSLAIGLVIADSPNHPIGRLFHQFVDLIQNESKFRFLVFDFCEDRGSRKLPKSAEINFVDRLIIGMADGDLLL